MSRCRFVQPDVVRLLLVDVHRRAYLARESLPAITHTKEEDEAKMAALETLQSAIDDAARDGDWIDVKRELNAGEQRHLFSGLVKDMTVGEKVTLDPEQVGLTKLVEYLVGWSFVNADGRPEPVSESAISNLDTETFREVTEAIDWHEAQVELARTARKKKRDTTTVS